MLSAKSKQLIHSAPGLRGLSPAERRSLEARFEERTLEQGDVLYREGEPCDAVYILTEGTIEFTIGDRPLARLGPGELFGEQGALSEAPRGATAIAARDSTVLALPVQVFRDLTRELPELHEHLTETFEKRAVAIATGDAYATSEAALVLGVAPWPARLANSRQVAKEVENQTGEAVAILAITKNPLPQDVAPDRGPLDAILQWSGTDGRDLRRLVSTELSLREAEAGFLFVLLDQELREFAPDLGPLCDTLILTFRAEMPEIAREPGQRTVVVHDLATGPGPELGDNAVVSVPAEEPARSRALGRLARHLARQSVGLALGSGAAWGFAHIGVLDVFDEAGIDVDVIAGASMGAIIGAHYALGFSPQELEEISTSVKSVTDFVRIMPNLLYLASDFNLLKPGMFAGEHFQRVLESMGPITDRTFADLRIPFRAVATNVATGGRAEICEGTLSDALRASFSAPWVFTPFPHETGPLIDGGMSDPVPIETTRAMGADLIVAVNVVPPVYPSAQSPLEATRSGIGGTSPFGSTPPPLPNSFDVLARTIQIMQHELGNQRVGEADILINPDLRDYWILEFWRAKPMIEAGRAAAREVLPEIRSRLDGLKRKRT